MGFTVKGTTTIETQQAGATQSFNNYGITAGDGVFSDAASVTTGTPGWTDIQVGWYAYGADLVNGIITAIDHATGAVSVSLGQFDPGHLYTFSSTPFPV